VQDGTVEGWGVTRPAAAIISNDEADFSFNVVNILKDADTLWKGPGGDQRGVLQEGSSQQELCELTWPNQTAWQHTARIVATRIFEIVALAGSPPKVTP
jgi:hypothetical protein